MSPYQDHLSRHSDIREHLGLLHGLALQCKQVVEFGFRTGISASAFLAAGANLRSFDIDSRCRTNVRHLAKIYPNTFVFKVGDSTKVEIPRCQMLFIDTDHTYKTTLAELRGHASMVDKWIVLHDTVSFGRKDRPPGDGPGVQTAVEAFLGGVAGEPWFQLLHLPHNNGLTILQRHRS